VDEFFFRAAELLPDRRFLLGGSGWEDRRMPRNVRYLGHVSTEMHNTLNCSPLAVLNISRESMAANGYSPATRLFEVAGAGACLISDAWEGIDRFLTPGREVLVARDGEQVARLIDGLDKAHARKIGLAARRRVLAEHTYEQRAELVERVLREALKARRPPPRLELRRRSGGGR
jgi:spore maturation protein CgeB